RGPSTGGSTSRRRDAGGEEASVRGEAPTEGPDGPQGGSEGSPSGRLGSRLALGRAVRRSTAGRLRGWNQHLSKGTTDDFRPLGRQRAPRYRGRGGGDLHARMARRCGVRR